MRNMEAVAAGLIAMARVFRPMIAEDAPRDRSAAQALVCIDAFLGAVDTALAASEVNIELTGSAGASGQDQGGSA